MKLLATMASLTAISVALMAFRPVSQRVDQAQAITRARTFASARGASLNAAAVRARQRNGVGKVALYEVVIQTKYGIKVDVEVATGRIVAYRDNETMESRRLAGPLRKFKIADRSAASRHVDKLAQKLGLPATWKRVAMDFYLDNTPGRGDSDRTGALTATYQPMPNGYPFFNFAPTMRLRVDPASGHLVEYTYFNHTTTSASTISVSTARAVELAEAAHERDRLVARLAHKAVSPASIGWAVPNGMFGSKLPADTTAPFVARLVYKVPFSSSFVWVDAVSGVIVGGDVYK